MLFRDEIFEQDVETIRDILAFTGFFEGAPDEIDADVKNARHALKDGNTTENYAFLFLEHDGKTAGYVCFARAPCTVSTFEIHWPAVHNDHRGKGMGKRLPDNVVETVRQAGATKLILKTAGRDLLSLRKNFIRLMVLKKKPV